jgi:hypothetical protein
LDFRVSSSSSSSKYDIFEYNLSHKYFTRVYNGGYTEESFRFSELSRCDNLPLFNKDCFPGHCLFHQLKAITTCVNGVHNFMLPDNCNKLQRQAFCLFVFVSYRTIVAAHAYLS